MTDDSSILYALDAGVATLTFNRPDKLNALIGVPVGGGASSVLVVVSAAVPGL